MQQQAMLLLQQVRCGSISLPPRSFLVTDGLVTSCSREGFHEPLAQAINGVRQHGLAQLLGDRGSTGQRDREYQHEFAKAFELLLRVIELPGEQITADIKWTKQGPVVITLKHGEIKQDEPRKDDGVQAPASPKIYRAPATDADAPKGDAPPAPAMGWADPND